MLDMNAPFPYSPTLLRAGQLPNFLYSSIRKRNFNSAEKKVWESNPHGQLLRKAVCLSNGSSLLPSTIVGEYQRRSSVATSYEKNHL